MINLSMTCCLVVTCWKRADLLALVCDVYCVFVTYSYGIRGQVWYLIVSIPDLCWLSYFYAYAISTEAWCPDSYIATVSSALQFLERNSNICHIMRKPAVSIKGKALISYISA